PLHPLSARPAILDDKRSSRKAFAIRYGNFRHHAVVGTPRIRREFTPHVAALRIVEFYKGIIRKHAIRVAALLRAIPARGDRRAYELRTYHGRLRIVKINLKIIDPV